MKKTILVLIIFVLTCYVMNFEYKIVSAQTLSDNISEQLNNLDLKSLEEYYNSVIENGTSFFTYITKLLRGEYQVEFEDLSSYVFNIFIQNVKLILPGFVSIVVISILCGILGKNNGLLGNSSTGDIVSFIGLISIILILSIQIIALYKKTENTIQNIANLIQIMSPIILVLMIGSGATVSASVYKPTVVFLSNGVINIVLSVVMPLISIMIIFNVLSNFTSSIKLEKFSELSASIIKWVIGLACALFGMFLSIQGITSATFDGISIKATKYALSNSIPIVGGFIKDGFDLVIAGSILIKNAIGITCVIILFYMILSPILYLATFSILLKLICAIIEPITDNKITSFCLGMSKCISYLLVAIISVSFMLFITILLMMFSANAFI